jgi:two-component system LytT family response regulator
MNDKKIKALLVDDEEGNLLNLANLLTKHCPNISIAGKATSSVGAFPLVHKLKPDVVFLDIQMPDENGFDLLKKFEVVPFEVIFVTAFDLYGIQAVKFSALDYLLKPIDVNELQLGIKKLTAKLNQNSNENLIENLKSQMLSPGDKSKHKIALPSINETHLVRTADIIHCISDNSYTTFYINDGSTYLVCKSIKEYEILLQDYGFIRVHQSHLINKEYVKSISKKEGITLIMSNEAKIPVSKNRKEDVLKLLY